ncbi:MAG: hypothetical protein GY880_24800 [Planctomycetaceae bacterium]|nr:hypothetical protein [Planctomycetaceae bacterium]
MSFDIVAWCAAPRTNSKCGLKFNEECMADPTNCLIGDMGLELAQYQAFIPAIVLVLGTAFLFRLILQHLGIYR